MDWPFNQNPGVTPRVSQEPGSEIPAGEHKLSEVPENFAIYRRCPLKRSPLLEIPFEGKWFGNANQRLWQTNPETQNEGAGAWLCPRRTQATERLVLRKLKFHGFRPPLWAMEQAAETQHPPRPNPGEKDVQETNMVRGGWTPKWFRPC